MKWNLIKLKKKANIRKTFWKNCIRGKKNNSCEKKEKKNLDETFLRKKIDKQIVKLWYTVIKCLVPIFPKISEWIFMEFVKKKQLLITDNSIMFD